METTRVQAAGFPPPVYPVSDLIFILPNYPDILRSSKFRTIELFNMHPWLCPGHRGMFATRLMKQGADLSSANYIGKTVLMRSIDHSVETKGRRIFDLLLGYGTGHRLNEKNGKSVTDYLRERSTSDLQSSLPR